MLGKLVRFMRADKPTRNRRFRNKMQQLRGRLNAAAASPCRTGYWSYAPDSVWFSRSHPEIRELFELWCRGHATVNAGDLVRFYSLFFNIKQIATSSVNGDFAELGVYKGNSAAMLAHFAAKSGRHLYLFDTFSGFDESDLVDLDENRSLQFSDTSLEGVRALVGHRETCTYVEGVFPKSIPPIAEKAAFAFVHIDCDLYKPMRDALDFFYQRLVPGGMIIVHDYSSGEWAGATQALDEFRASAGVALVLLPDKSGSAVITRPLQATE